MKPTRRVKNTKRVSFNLTLPQIDRLKQLSTSTGLTVAEHLRRAIDNYKPLDK